MAVVGSNVDSVTNVNTTGTLTQEVKTYYEKVFLARSEYELILKEGGQMRTHPTNEGRSVNFTRYNPLTIITTPLGEGSNPVTCALNASTVTMTLSEYGLTTTNSKMLSLTSIDSNMAEKVGLVGQNMGETLNRLVRNDLANGTPYYGNNHTVATFAAGDTMDACDIRLMTQTMELNKAMPYKDGLFIGKTEPTSKAFLLADSTWINSKTYSDVKDLYRGEPISPLFLKFGGGEKSLIPSEGGFSNVQLSILIGSILGDGCLYKPKPTKIIRGDKEYICGYNSCIFEEQYTEKQKEYLMWKAKMLFPYAKVSILNRSFGQVYKLFIRPGRKDSKIKTILNTLRQLFYPNGKKIIPNELRIMMNKIVFAVWFFDDGAISINGKNSITLERKNLKRMARLSTCAFSYKDQLKIAKALHKNLSIQPTIRKECGYYRMAFNSMNGMFDKVRDILEEIKSIYGVGGMDYKIPTRVETKWGTAHNSRRYSPN